MLCMFLVRMYVCRKDLAHSANEFATKTIVFSGKPRSMTPSEAFAPKLVHCVIKMRGHVYKRMLLVRVCDLVKQDISMLQRLGERQSLLEVHVVIRGTVYQHVLFAAYSLRSSIDIRVVVTFEVVLRSRQSHESFRVDGICNESSSDSERSLLGLELEICRDCLKSIVRRQS